MPVVSLVVELVEHPRSLRGAVVSAACGLVSGCDRQAGYAGRRRTGWRCFPACGRRGESGVCDVPGTSRTPPFPGLFRRRRNGLLIVT